MDEGYYGRMLDLSRTLAREMLIRTWVVSRGSPHRVTSFPRDIDKSTGIRAIEKTLQFSGIIIDIIILAITHTRGKQIGTYARALNANFPSSAELRLQFNKI